MVWQELALRASSAEVAGGRPLTKESVSFPWCGHEPDGILCEVGPLLDLPGLVKERTTNTGRVYGVLAYWPILDSKEAASAVRDELACFAQLGGIYQVPLRIARLRVAARLAQEGLMGMQEDR